MGFDADWLALRAPADSESRARPLERLLAEHLRARAAGAGGVEILDLGCGTGANLRHLAPRLAPILAAPQRWRLLDHDAALLAEVPAQLARWAESRGWRARAGDAEVRIEGAEAPLEAAVRRADLAAAPPGPDGADLVTGSALLDLVSEAWLSGLADRLSGAGAAALFALSYDGRVAWQPSVPGDEEVLRLVNRHQRGDKGFGPALGPSAAAAAAEIFAARGFAVEQAAADWALGPADQALQQHLHAGWAAAACAAAPHRAEAIQAWLGRRIDLLEAGQGRVTVGHQDLLALPRGRD